MYTCQCKGYQMGQLLEEVAVHILEQTHSVWYPRCLFFLHKSANTTMVTISTALVITANVDTAITGHS